MSTHTYDVIVIGGASAGLSGALTLTRARRSVLVIDAGEPRNAPAAGVHGLLTRDGLAPADLVELGTAEVVDHGGEVQRGRVRGVRRVPDGFAVTVDDGSEHLARRLLVTTGLVDELPEIPGLRELWGRDVLHCPYCHGWEVRDQPIGVLGTGPFAVHQALLFRQWSADVTLFLHTAPEPTGDEWEQLAARGISVVDGEVVAVERTDGRLSGVRLASGTVVERRALAVATHMRARADFLDALGVATVEHPRGVGRQIGTDAMGQTSVAGVWAAGNAADLPGNVVTALSAGMMAGAMINADLVTEDTQRAVARREARDPFSAASEARVAELVAGDRRHGLVPARIG